MTVQARNLRPTDLPVLAFHSHRFYPNQAMTLDRAFVFGATNFNLRKLIQTILWPGRGSHTWISRDGSSLLGLISLRRRTDQTAWEIDTLISTTKNDVFLLDLLDRAVATAAVDGAHRLFVRLVEGSPAIEVVQSQGFIPIASETIYEIPTLPKLPSWISNLQTIHYQNPLTDQELFQLYCQVTPREARWQTALSPSEWRGAQESLGSRGKEYFVASEKNKQSGSGGESANTGLIRITTHRKTSAITVLVPSQENIVNTTINTALSIAITMKSQRTHLSVPDYDSIIHRTASKLEMRNIGKSIMLVRPIAQRVRRLELAEKSVEKGVRSAVR